VERKEQGLTSLDELHVKVMQAVVEGLVDTPLVLKGGTALMLAYSLDRFSEDLDFDAPKSLKLDAKIRRSLPYGVSVVSLSAVKDTEVVTRYRLVYRSGELENKLKLEISYRTPCPAGEIRHLNGFNVTSLTRIADQKLRAAHDGDKPRTAVRDLFDLEFLARRWPTIFDEALSARLREFASSEDAIVQRYGVEFLQDRLVSETGSIGTLARGITMKATELVTSASEVEKRLELIDSLKERGGAAYTFWRHAKGALTTASKEGATPREVDWHKVEEASLRECISKHGQSGGEVHSALIRSSPGAVTTERQLELLLMIEREEPALRSAYSGAADSARNDAGTPDLGA
jgi:predicted nucleotidyltransferase component of viral defense system